MTRPLLFAVAMLCACTGTRSGPDPSGAQAEAIPSFTSGSRLRAHYFDGGGGARAFLDFRDTKLGTPCRFAVSSDGLRCLPTASATKLFRDEHCTEPVALFGDDASAC